MGVVEWIDSLVPGAPVEVLWDDAFWPSKIVELVGRPTVEEAETMSVAAAAAEEKAKCEAEVEPNAKLQDVLLLAQVESVYRKAVWQEVTRQDASGEPPQKIFLIAALGYATASTSPPHLGGL